MTMNSNAHYCMDYLSDEGRRAMLNVVSENRRRSNPLDLLYLTNATIVPPQTIANGGGIWDGMHYLQESILHDGWYGAKSFKAPGPCEYRDEVVVYIGMFYACWGHCITDGLKHIWPFVSGEIRSLQEKGAKLVYVTTGLHEKLPANFVECLKLLGCDLRDAEKLDRPVRFRTVVMPKPSFFLDREKGRFYTAEFVSTIEALVTASQCENVTPIRRVYLTRSAWKTAKADRGESAVARAFAKAGFDVVSPEALTFSEQVRLMRSCSELATTDGSCAHNALFMHSCAKLVIVRKAEYVNGYQLAINDLRRLTVTYVDANWSRLLGRPKEPWRGPFFLYVSDELKSFLRVEASFPCLDFVLYLCDYVKMRSRVLASIVKHRWLGL